MCVQLAESLKPLSALWEPIEAIAESHRTSWQYGTGNFIGGPRLRRLDSLGWVMKKKNQFIGRQIIVRSVPHEFSCSCAAPREHQCQRLFLHVFHTFCVVFCMFFTCSAIFLHVFHMVCERCHPRRHCNLFSVWSVANLKISTVMGHPKFRRSLLSGYPKRESQTTMTSITAIFKVGY